MRGVDFELDPGLVEESVLQASEAAEPEIRRRYRAERDAIYEIADAEAREVAFRDLDERWFRTLALDTPLAAALREFPSVLSRVSRCVVLKAVRSRDEGADLYESRCGIPALALKLTPRSLLEIHHVAPLLRSELLHVDDMLDPEFGYERALPALRADAVHEKLVRDRYRVLWNTSVDGRLASRGWLPEGGEARRRREFLAWFSPLGAEAERRFETLFFGPRPSHRELLDLATCVGGHRAHRCPLCRFPVSGSQRERQALPPLLIDAIRRDFPRFHSSEVICLQCRDLYEARACLPVPQGDAGLR